MTSGQWLSSQWLSGTIFTEPETRCEILLVEDGEAPFGAAYDPRRMGDALAWHADCEHCRRGRQQEKINLHLRRAIQILTTRRFMGNEYDSPIHEYKIPSSSDPYIIKHWIEDDDNGDRDHEASITCPSGKHLHAYLPENRPLKIQGDGERRSIAFQRALRFLFSSRPTRPSEIAGVASFFTQLPTGLRKGRRNPCLKIDWTQIGDKIARKEVEHDQLQATA